LLSNFVVLWLITTVEW